MLFIFTIVEWDIFGKLVYRYMWYLFFTMMEWEKVLDFIKWSYDTSNFSKREERLTFSYLYMRTVSFPFSLLIYFQDFWQTSERDFFQELFKSRLKKRWRRSRAIVTVFYFDLKTKQNVHQNQTLQTLPITIIRVCILQGV